MNEKPKLPIDARVIAIDETRYYDIEAADKPLIKKILGVYLYDKNEVTHCCELTPSYWLIHLYNLVIFTEEGEALDEITRDLKRDYYEMSDSEDKYFHCHDVDEMEAKAEKGTYHIHGDPGVPLTEVPRDDQMEALHEHFVCNHVI